MPPCLLKELRTSTLPDELMQKECRPPPVVNRNAMAILEEDVLEAKDPKIKDSDNWPSYTLKRVKVLSQKTGDPVSLFAANIDNPVQVFGILEPLNPSYRQYRMCELAED